MPWRQPGFWAEILGGLSQWWSIYAYAPAMAFLVAVVRGVLTGSGRLKTVLEGVLFALLTVSLRPLLLYFEMNEDMALFFGAFLAFLGADFIRRHIDAFARRWLKGDT